MDAGAIITKGYFQLAFGHSSSLSTDAGQPTYSYLIPFDASPGQVSSALGNVQGISVNQVTRCQTGYNGIALPCPKQSQGAYQWLVFLNTPVALSTDLYVLKYDFGSTWTGVGSQVKIHRFQQGMTSTNQCIDGICSYNCKNLLQSMGYSFRTRVLTTEGWTDYSAASEYVSTLEARAPGRPPPPFMLTSSTTLVAMQIYTPPSIEGVTSVESQYRAIGAPAWMNGPSFIFAVNQPAIILLTSLAAGLSYEMRIRSINHYGHSGYSGSSPSFKLQSTTVLNTSIDSLIQLIGVTYNSANLSLSSDPKIFLGQATFEVQYQSVFDTFWSSGVSTSLTSSIPGVFVQQVSTRSDSPSSYCEGTFQLSMGPVDPTNLNYYVTLPIQFNASADVMAAAIGAIGLVAATVPPPSIAVTQSMGDFNGWSWSIEIQGLAQDTPLQLFRSSLLNSFGGPCFSEGNSVVTQVVKAGSATQISSTKYVNIGGLLPQTTYLFRLHLTTADLTQLFSDPINATTLAFVVPTPVVAPPVYSEIMIKVAGGSTVTAANGSLAARSTDFYYTSPIATGGTFGMKGGDGYCVVILHDVYKLETFGVKYYFYSGYPQRLAVPLSADLTNLITFKCWGGGGGGKNSVFNETPSLLSVSCDL